MGYDILAIALLLLSIAAAGVYLVARERARRSGEGDVGSIWAEYARTHGLDYVAPEGEWPNRTVPRIGTGDLQIVLVRESDHVVTRMELRPKQSLLGRVLVTTSETKTTLPRVTLTEERALEALGDEVSIFAKPPQVADSVLTMEVARALSGFRMGGAITFEYERGHIVLEWVGGERNTARLDEARRVVELADRAISAAFHHS